MPMFPTPAVLLEYMLQREAEQEAACTQFPPLRAFQPLYDVTSVFLKLTLIGLDRQSKATVESAARGD